MTNNEGVEMNAPCQNDMTHGDEPDIAAQRAADDQLLRDLLSDEPAVPNDSELHHALRNIDEFLNELHGIQSAYIGGTVDYEEAGGFLLEYIDEIGTAMRLQQDYLNRQTEIDALKTEVINLTFACELFKNADKLSLELAERNDYQIDQPWSVPA